MFVGQQFVFETDLAEQVVFLVAIERVHRQQFGNGGVTLHIECGKVFAQQIIQSRNIETSARASVAQRCQITDAAKHIERGLAYGGTEIEHITHAKQAIHATLQGGTVFASKAITGIIQFDIEEGQSVSENQIVGYIDSTQLFLKKEQLIASQKGLQSRRPDIRKQMAVLEQQIATANTEKKRVENLLKANAATTKQLDDVNARN